MSETLKEIPDEWLSFFKSLASRILPEEYKWCTFFLKEEDYCVCCFSTSENNSSAFYNDYVFVSFGGHYNFEEKPQDPRFFNITYNIIKDALIKTVVVILIEKTEGEKLLISL